MNRSSGELEANDRRLKTSQKAVLVASRYLTAAKGELLEAETLVKTLKDSLEVAKLGLEYAREAAESANTDYMEALADKRDAEARAAEAQKKWRVIDLAGSDDKDDTSKDRTKRNSKRKKRSKESRNPLNDAVTMTAPNALESAEVRGCRIRGANGTYRKSGFFHLGHQLFCKQGKWKGEERTFALCFGVTCSYLGVLPLHSTTSASTFFQVTFYASSIMNGWKSILKQCDPTPKIILNYEEKM